VAKVRVKLAPGTSREIRFQDRMQGAGEQTYLIVVGTGQDRVAEPFLISAASRLICSVWSALSIEPALPSFSLSATPTPCTFILNEILQE
jgi:hypothetical protein